MSDTAHEAPLFARCMALCRWLFERFGAQPTALLGRTIEGDALRLLDHVVLALKNFEREENVDGADADLVLLRVHLRLAHEVGLIDERQFVHVTGETTEIGRQIGGWQRKLAAPRS